MKAILFVILNVSVCFPRGSVGVQNLDSRGGLGGRTKKISRLAIARHDPPCNTPLIFKLLYIYTIQHNKSSSARSQKYKGLFHFLDQSFAETQDQTAQLWSQSRVQINQSCTAHIAAHSIMSSLISSLMYPYFFIYE